jgi:hypothetical protein
MDLKLFYVMMSNFIRMLMLHGYIQATGGMEFI